MDLREFMIEWAILVGLVVLAVGIGIAISNIWRD